MIDDRGRYFAADADGDGRTARLTGCRQLLPAFHAMHYMRDIDMRDWHTSLLAERFRLLY